MKMTLSVLIQHCVFVRQTCWKKILVIIGAPSVKRVGIVRECSVYLELVLTLIFLYFVRWENGFVSAEQLVLVSICCWQ